jgi:uncharacterized protein with LGFP repeats
MPEVIGAIRDKWLALGGEGFSGPALDVERPTFDGVGRAQSFQNGVVISWHPSTGAFAVWGAIAQAWLSVGRERSPLGYPTSDEFGPRSKRRSNFQRGFIDWTPQRGARIHGPVLID